MKTKFFITASIVCCVLVVIILRSHLKNSLEPSRTELGTTQEPANQGNSNVVKADTQKAIPDIPRIKANINAKAAPQSSAGQVPTNKPEEISAISEKTLVGTKWGSDQFKVEFGPAGKLLIDGNERANWLIEKGRVKLYSNDGWEVHWLDIEGNKLSWNGEPIGRFK